MNKIIYPITLMRTTEKKKHQHAKRTTHKRSYLLALIQSKLIITNRKLCGWRAVRVMLPAPQLNVGGNKHWMNEMIGIIKNTLQHYHKTSLTDSIYTHTH